MQNGNLRQTQWRNQASLTSKVNDLLQAIKQTFVDTRTALQAEIVLSNLVTTLGRTMQDAPDSTGNMIRHWLMNWAAMEVRRGVTAVNTVAKASGHGLDAVRYTIWNRQS
jgi:predicted transcriptional regulator